MTARSLLLNSLYSCSFSILSKTDSTTFRREHESRISNLEDILRKLTEKSEVCVLDLSLVALAVRERRGRPTSSCSSAFKVPRLGDLLLSFVKLKKLSDSCLPPLAVPFHCVRASQVCLSPGPRGVRGAELWPAPQVPGPHFLLNVPQPPLE